MISFDQILEKKIGTGFYQFKTMSIVGLVEFCNGILFTFMSIMMSILKSEWSLTSSQIANIGSSYLLGIVLGNILCAFLVDKIGRKTTFAFSTAICAFLCFQISFTNTYIEMILLRLLFGAIFGITYQLGFIILSEITEAKFRGRFSFSVSLLFVLGKICLIILCFVFLDSLESGNWRGLMLFNGIPLTIAFVLSFIFLKETIRYQLNLGKFEQAFEEIEIILEENGKEDRILNEEEKKGLQLWQEKQQVEFQEQQLQKYGIFSSEYKTITLLLWLIYVLANFQSMTIYLLMPFLLAQKNSGFSPMLILFIIEFCFSIIIYHFIDNPHYGGRINIIAYSGVALLLSNGLLFIFQEKILYLGLFVIKIATRGLFSTIGILACESYPLYLRSQGCGIAQAIGKIGVIPSPYFLFPLLFFDPYLPFLLMALLSILILIFAYVFDKDKTQKHLETLKEE
ncbi:unnamed protein product [Paramecium pentaurelia]|uniref:Major facilitator superfamily (MFS) profile domain-containing protein n=1 Tax=Paramecium pentaurelia TaxID=43138 RepID=A0A8S1VM69_9CILI|nr:unnamed protein product [Paramecium pentaurelia]